MKRHLILLIPVLLALAGCQSSGIGGGKNRYEYPPSKLSTPKDVKAASLDGRFLILDDGSTWNIDWNDASKARRWGAGDRLNVITTQGKAFPYVLIKQSSGERVAARYGKKLD
jgi:hypothetical protein